MSDPLQYAREEEDHKCVEGKHRSDDRLLCFPVPVVTIEGDNEKGNVYRDEDGYRSPPWIHPREGRRLYKEDFEDREEGGIAYGEEKTAVDAKELCLRVFRQELAEGKTGNGKHKAQFDTDADEYQKGCAGGSRPQCVAAEMLNQRVHNFDKPVHHIKGQSGGYAVPVLVLDLAEIDIDHYREEGDNVPLERFSAPQNRQRLLRNFRVVHDLLQSIL